MLFTELSPEQGALLELVWECIPRASQGGLVVDWPVWDYVRRGLYRQFPELESAEALLRSLPSASRPSNFFGQPYGLVWHSGTTAGGVGVPDRSDRIGLTIAGLTVLARRDKGTSELADALAGIVAQAARTDEQQQPNMFEAVDAKLELDSYLNLFEAPTSRTPFAFPGRMIVAAFESGREYPNLQVARDSERYVITLGWMSLREFRDVESAEDYLARIEALASAQRPAVRYSSPLGLIETLDYLGYVLADAPSFKWSRLTAAPTLQSAAALVADVRDRATYDAALSGLWNVISQLQVPQLPAEVVASKHNGAQPGSLGRLRYWLDDLLDDAGAGRAVQAVSLIQKVGRLRAAAQHADPGRTDEAMKTRRAFDLPDFISDYGAAWDSIRDQVAGAFDVIRQEVQLASS
ncbi:MAG: hypothetical protein KQH57_10080 [Actinomycetales bacterium]|nr:hypothetical protein [Actinomycetales bacterium]